MRRLIYPFAACMVLTLLASCAAPGGSGSTNAPGGPDPNYDAAGKQRAVKVTQTARGAQITIDDRVLFDFGKAVVKPEGLVLFERVADLLNKTTAHKVLVEGHTDNVGTPASNMLLSEQRAAAVKQGLVAKGVPATRIEAKGLGLTQPVADNNTAEGRQANRRAEIIVLGETVEKITGSSSPTAAASLGDQLASGLDRFLKNAGEFITNVFGGSKKE